LKDVAIVAAEAPAATATFVLTPLVSNVSVCAVTSEVGLAATVPALADLKLAKFTVDAVDDVLPKAVDFADEIDTDIVSLAFAPTWKA
jgi:cysteine sulfinate desulfinase/cysteine desulfurase-like protein